MLIELTMLPPAIQEQILTVKQGNVVQFSYNGEVIANVSQSTAKDTPDNDSLMATAGLWDKYDIDGMDYQNQIRNEWDREWN